MPTELTRFLQRLLVSNRRRHSTARLGHVETCEKRVLLAGNVAAAVNGGDLVVTGDAASNEVQVVFDGGDVVVRGLNGTTVNGGAADFVAFAATNVIAGSLHISGEEGNDVIHVRDVVVTDELEVEGGKGNDRVVIQAVATDGIDVQTGAGNDEIMLENIASTEEVGVIDLSGSSLVIMDNVTAATGDVFVLTGKSSDIIQFVDVSTIDSLFASTGKGKDVVVIGGTTQSDALGIDTGAGSDVVIISNLTTSNPAQRTAVHLGSGNDYQIVLDGNLQAPVDFQGGPGKNDLLMPPGVLTPNGFTSSGFQSLLALHLLESNSPITKLADKFQAKFIAFQDFVNSLP